MRAQQKDKPDYGFDAPILARNVIGLVVVGMAALVVLAHSASVADQVARSVISSLVEIGTFAIILSIIYVKVEKFRHRDRMLALLSWQGSEQVLDIGTGRGLLMIGAAKRLTSGTSFGIDIWSREDMKANSPAATGHNAELEGVADKVVITSANAQCLPFADASFDYILSNLCLHNIPTSEGRDAACREIARVLKPGGRVVLSDFLHTQQYASVLEQQGLNVSRSVSFLAAPFLLTIVSAQKS